MHARPSWHARRATSALLAALLAAASATALLLLPDPARAVAAAPAAGISITPAGYGPVQLGPLEGTAGSDEHGYCVQARVAASGAADAPQGLAHVDDPQLGAALARHRWATDDLTQAALGYEIHQRHERPGFVAGGDVAAVKVLLADATPQAVKDRAAQIMAEAAAEAGPWAGAAGTVSGSGGRTGEIRGIELRSAAGRPVVGASFTVTLTGPAVLDASGTRTYTGTTAGSPVALAWTATGNGTVGYSIVFPDAPRTTVTVVELPSNRQDQLTYGNRPAHDIAEITVPGEPFEVVKDFRPRATTSVRDTVVADGDPLVDVVTFTAAPGDTWVELDGVPVALPADVTWYGPYDSPQPQAAAAPAGAPVAGVERVVARGPGTTATTGAVRATGNGFYTAVVTIRRADAGPFAEYVREDFAAPWFEQVETAVNRFDLAHESQTREFNVVPGGRAFDRITVTGYPDDHGGFGGLGDWAADLGEATVTVYGPLAALPTTAEVPEGTPVHWTDTVAAVNGSFDVGYDDAHPVVAPARATHPGGDYFVFVYAFAGDDRVDAFVSPFDDPREAFYVPGPPEVVVPPSVVTRARATTTTGGSMHDVALVTGATDPGDHLVFRAYGPQDPDADPVCDEDALLWTSDAVPVAGAGLYDSGPAPAPDRAGAVSWVETLLAEDGTVRHTGTCGLPYETTLVTPDLAVRTEARAGAGVDGGAAAVGEGEPVVGDDLWDVVVVSGTVPAGATTVVDLFHTPEGEELVCADPVWTSEPIPLGRGAGEYVTGRYPTTAPGTYGFVERTTAADGTPLSAGTCGDPAETLTVAAPEPQAPAPEPEQPLAVTGADGALLSGAALVLVVAGVGVVAHRARLRRALDAAEDDDAAWPVA
ncbi:hypothetical protein [Cellulomonas pakistanensis]|uniref:Uncharacterized protein n=1 Tax=Cellulomonas pakistanensis TaxID=992287 RepID=A0A919PET0_9CELL|nr:hypothetical protein [Cellulomonas pakistanensis]GIG36857.1 hypothetical protein Cpa01nite_22380 [Cellulomonas pakistanensis]